MKDLKTLIAEAKKKAPPLNFASNSGHKNVVLIEEELHPMLKKLNKHRASLDNRKSLKDEPTDWQNFKHNMIMNLETKRKEEWEHQKEVHKMNDSEEELEELPDELDDDDFENGDSPSHSQEDVEEAQDEIDKIFGGDDDEEDQEEEEEGEDNNNNHLKDDDEEENETATTKSSKSLSRTILDSDDEDGENFVSLSGRLKPKVIEDDEEFDDNAMGFDSQSCLEEDKKIDFTSSIYGQGGEAIFNAETGDSNDVLQFCSGQFNTQKCGETQTSPDSDDSDDESDNADIEENTISESGGDLNENDDGFEGDLEDTYNDFVDTQENDEEQDEEEELVIHRKPKKSSKLKMADFLEQEAELSGSEGDVSSDEEDVEDEYEVDEVQEDLPSDDELRQQVERMYKKQELDEDKRQLLLLQERYLEDGDLHEDGNRTRKFKWNLNNDEDNEFTNILSDSEDDTQSSGEEDNFKGIIQLKKPILKESTTSNLTQDSSKDAAPSTMIEKLDSNEAITETIITKNEETTCSRVTFSQALESTRMFRKATIKRKKMIKVSSFFVKDDRLRGLLNKRPTANSNDLGPGPSKRSRTDEDSSSKSIFDLL